MNDNKRIALNTSVLYVKLVIATLIGLFVSRQVLLALGADDYGLFAVVGGLVEMMNILGVTMITTSYRYIAVEIGKGDKGNPRKVYNTLFVVHVFLALFVVLLGETFGTFYINNYLNVAENKVPDALFVLHFSLIATAITVISVPSQGLIVAREKFVYTAMLEIVDLLLKLCCIIWLVGSEGNRLRSYSLISTGYISVLAIGYLTYCVCTSKEIVRWQINRNWKDYVEIFSFSFYILIGAIAFTGRIQGVAIIINSFFGTALNAAFGLASQVYNYSSTFVRNLTQAASPQIMKSYGAQNEERSITLVYVISKMSYMMMLLVALPLIFYMDDVLRIWLKTPPRYTAIFASFLLINALINCLSSGFDASIQASGKVKKNQIGYSLLNISLLPIVWIMYYMGLPVYSNVLAMILITILTVIFQCWIMQGQSLFKYRDYWNKTIRPSLYVTVLSVLPLMMLRLLLGTGIVSCVIFIGASIMWTSLSVYMVGLSNVEKHKIKEMVINKINKKEI